MDTIDFFRLIWPEAPNTYYCIGELVSAPGRPRPFWKHHVFPTILGAAAKAQGLSIRTDAYNCIHTLKAPTGPEGQIKGVRAGPNMGTAWCFYGDLDVGKSTDADTKFASQRAAIEALYAFCVAANLPRPMTISSGRGVHVYWLIVEVMQSHGDWKRIAEKLKRLAKALGFAWDVSVPGDLARVLRGVGTWNRKDPENPLPVKLVGTVPARIPMAEFEALIDTALAALPAGVDAPTIEGEVVGLIHDGAPPSGPPPKMKDLRAVCPAMEVLANMAPHASNPVWHITTGLCAFLENGRVWAHRLASSYITPPNGEPYTVERTDAKVDQWLKLTGGPRCASVQTALGAAAPCGACQYRPQDRSPLTFARNVPLPLPEGIPQPGRPWARTKGGVTHTYVDTPGAPPIVDTILPYDLYPVSIVHEHHMNTRALEWAVVIPDSPTVRGRTVSLRVPAGEMNNERAILAALNNAGAFPDGRNGRKLVNYMSHYIRMLQKHQEEQVQHESLGWTIDRKRFVLPDGVISKTGVTPARLSPNLANLAQTVARSGTLEGQVETLKFYDYPEYIPQQFIVMSGLASILIALTAHEGASINFNGESGMSKTTALLGTASHFGPPKQYKMNGNPLGTTLKARIDRQTMYGTLPFVMDEITLQSEDDIKQLVMNITQEGGRTKREDGSREAKAPRTLKALLMVTTSNRSLHAHMGSQNQSGTASSMRALDITATGAVAEVHTKVMPDGRRVADQTKGDAFVRSLGEHHGHTGPALATWLIHNYDEAVRQVEAAIAEVSARAHTEISERFWVVVIGAVVAAARMSKRLGLTSYDPEAILTWAVDELVPAMRGDVTETYLGPADLLQDFLLKIKGNTLVVGQETISHGKIHASVVRAPHGPLAARQEYAGRTMYVLIEEFREYLKKRAISQIRVVKELKKLGIVDGSVDRASLGKGTEFADSGQHRVMKIDLAHPLLRDLNLVDEVPATAKVVKLRAG